VKFYKNKACRFYYLRRALEHLSVVEPVKVIGEIMQMTLS